MEYFDIGSLIKRVRKQKGMTQDDLAYPIIDRATLSRIENGKIIPNKTTLKALIERLGLDPYYVANFFLDEHETEAKKILNELSGLLLYAPKDENDPIIAQVDLLLTQLENNEAYMQNPLNARKLMINKARNASNKKEDPEKMIEILTNAIKICIPEYCERYIDDYYLSNDDLHILKEMADVYQRIGRYDDAINILYGMKNNFDKHCIDMFAKGRFYPVIMNNLANSMYDAKRFTEAVEICDIGIDVCIDTGFVRVLPTLASIKAQCLYELGDKEECEKILRQTYHAYGLYGTRRESARGEVQRFAKEKLGVTLE